MNMEMNLWYCPVCDVPTYNWRKCSKCGSDAIYQRFIMVEHENELPMCYTEKVEHGRILE